MLIGPMRILSRSDEESSMLAFCAGLWVGGFRSTKEKTSSVSARMCSQTERVRTPAAALNCPRELKEDAAGPETARFEEDADADPSSPESVTLPPVCSATLVRSVTVVVVSSPRTALSDAMERTESAGAAVADSTSPDMGLAMTGEAVHEKPHGGVCSAMVGATPAPSGGLSSSNQTPTTVPAAMDAAAWRETVPVALENSAEEKRAASGPPSAREEEDVLLEASRFAMRIMAPSSAGRSRSMLSAKLRVMRARSSGTAEVDAQFATVKIGFDAASSTPPSARKVSDAAAPTFTCPMSKPEGNVTRIRPSDGMPLVASMVTSVAATAADSSDAGSTSVRSSAPCVTSCASRVASSMMVPSAISVRSRYTLLPPETCLFSTVSNRSSTVHPA
mmetsp:Transcript_9618/g.23435  ORF Transcript_9618/g.23435 Transcript_9618/m.23435 type:complete len:391 (-) Transcript_9618:1009-2181(-)